jgi:hypothetical protein
MRCVGFRRSGVCSGARRDPGSARCRLLYTSQARACGSSESAHIQYNCRQLLARRRPTVAAPAALLHRAPGSPSSPPKNATAGRRGRVPPRERRQGGPAGAGQGGAGLHRAGPGRPAAGRRARARVGHAPRRPRDKDGVAEPLAPDTAAGARGGSWGEEGVCINELSRPAVEGSTCVFQSTHCTFLPRTRPAATGAGPRHPGRHQGRV